MFFHGIRQDLKVLIDLVRPMHLQQPAMYFNLKHNQEKIMADLATLQADVQVLTDQNATLKQAITDNAAATTAEIARVEAAIAALKSSGGIDPAALDPIVADIESSIAGLKDSTAAVVASTGALNAEQAAPAPEVPPAS